MIRNQGRMGGYGLGPRGECVCTNPRCQYRVAHTTATPCYCMKCIFCGSQMTRA